MWRGENLALTGTQTPTPLAVQPVSSRYTDCTFLVTLPDERKKMSLETRLLEYLQFCVNKILFSMRLHELHLERNILLQMGGN
jgi:hypothetical protein